MDTLIVVLLIIILILVLFSLSKTMNEAKITERLGKLEVEIVRELGEFKSDLSHHLNDDFTKLSESVEERLLQIREKVNERLDQNFEKTNQTFLNVMERLSKIDEAQKKIEGLSSDIVSLQSVLTDKKTRGVYGEVHLKHILSNVFGDGNDSIYRLQYTFSTGVIADAVLFAPEPLGTICIDSKFPLEHYQLMVDKKNSLEKREYYEKLFKADMKKHIDAIHDKYIIPGETTDQAILFLPAEAIFAEVNAYHSDLIQYSYKQRVWITSPTTLISTLTVIQMILKNMERDRYTTVIHEELNKLGLEFARYRERWDKLAKSIEAVNRDAQNVSITTDKISKKFDSIHQVNLQEIDQKEE